MQCCKPAVGQVANKVRARCPQDQPALVESCDNPIGALPTLSSRTQVGRSVAPAFCHRTAACAFRSSGPASAVALPRANAAHAQPRRSAASR